MKAILIKITAALAGVALVAAAAFAWSARERADRETALEFAAGLAAPRYFLDRRPLEERSAAVIAEMAKRDGESEDAIRRSLGRFAEGGILPKLERGDDPFLRSLARQHFESALVAAREMPRSWKMDATIGILELGRNRLPEAGLALRTAFEAAGKEDALDSREAIPMLAALGATHLARRVPSEAEPFLRRAAASAARHGGLDPRDHSALLTGFAHSLSSQGFDYEAEPVIERARSVASGGQGIRP